MDLRDNAIGVSAVSEKSFTRNGRAYGHVIDPRSGWPVHEAVLAAVVMPGATGADAASTALMVLGRNGLDALKRAEPSFRGLVMAPDGRVHTEGIVWTRGAGRMN